MTHPYKAIKKLKDISLKIGKYVNNVQGGGGNTSVKLNFEEMFIKASGYTLVDVDQKESYCSLELPQLKDFLNTCSDISDDDFSEKIQSFSRNTSKFRPSMESGLHALIPYTYVIHSHSIFANILNCSTEGLKIAKSLFPELLWLNYSNPGKELTLSLRDHLKVLKSKPQIIFLQNHGLIICSDDSHQAVELHEWVNETIISHFNVPRNMDQILSENDILDFQKKTLFPDQTVFTFDDFKVTTSAQKENLLAFKYIWSQILRLGLTPLLINKTKKEQIHSMKAEKFRQKIGN